MPIVLVVLDVASDHRDGAGEVLARKRGERQARRDTLADANGVALEGVNGEPERGKVADAKRWCRWIQHLPNDRGPLDHRLHHLINSGIADCFPSGPIAV